MTESQLFVSSCSRRELARRRGHARADASLWLQRPTWLVLMLFFIVCAGAFLAGHGGL